MAKNKVVEKIFKPKSKTSLGRHTKSDSPNKGSKKYKKPYSGQGR